MRSARDAEDDVHHPGEEQVEAVHDRHHDDDEAQHDQGVLDELLPGRRDDLAELREHLADEEGDPLEEVQLLLTGRAARGDDFAVRCVTGPDVFELPEGLDTGVVSVFSANDTARGVIERGLEYSLDDEPLSNRTSLGLSNELTGKPAAVSVEEGTLYVFYPLATGGAATVPSPATV